MAIWDDVFDTFGKKGFEAIGYAIDGEVGKMTKALMEGVAIQEVKDTAIDAVGKAVDFLSDKPDN